MKVFEGCEVGRIRLVTEKVVVRHMTLGATGIESGGKESRKRRQMSRKLE
jgi:hypothetical protein